MEQPGSTPPEVVAVADNLVRLTRAFNRIKSQFLAVAKQDVDWAAHLLIAALAGNGPMRAGALADAVHSDPSTVSRQIAPLVKDGLVERRADPVDGRASVLAATERGLAAYREHQQVRYTRYERILESWSTEDRRQFGNYLARFTTDLERGRVDWFEHPTPAAGHADATPSPTNLVTSNDHATEGTKR
jgi:DNA-binding MarR family transcriptional regulator